MELYVDIEKQLGDFRLRSRFETGTERFALLGPSGCGKTMTLKCIAGIEKPDRGIIRLGDRVLFDSDNNINVRPRKRKTGFLFQNYALFPNMTVRENVLAAAGDPEYAGSLLARFGLEDVEGLYPRSLSGGQSQRTALARMLASEPDILMFDEPFSALDNYLAMRMERELMDILEQFPGPSILVTHDRNEAYRMADTIGVMESGSIVEVKERHDFFERPDTVAAARLTGCKNISAVSKTGEGTYYASDWGIEISCDDDGLGDAASVGYRAHYFTPVRAGESKNTFDCEIVRVTEDTFSVIVLFRQRGNVSDSDDSVLTWVADKNVWEAVRDDIAAGASGLAFDATKLMKLRGPEERTAGG